jgi:hypothetical protein
MSLESWDRRQREHLLKCLCNLKELQTLHIFAADVSLDFMLGNDWCWTPPRLQRLTVGVVSDVFEVMTQVDHRLTKVNLVDRIIRVNKPD